MTIRTNPNLTNFNARVKSLGLGTDAAGLRMLAEFASVDAEALVGQYQAGVFTADMQDALVTLFRQTSRINEEEIPAIFSGASTQENKPNAYAQAVPIKPSSDVSSHERTMDETPASERAASRALEIEELLERGRRLRAQENDLSHVRPLRPELPPRGSKAAVLSRNSNNDDAERGR